MLDEACDFASAFIRLADGENVRREAWNEDSYIKAVVPVPEPRVLVLSHIKEKVFLRGTLTVPHIVVVERGKEKSIWICASEDVLATDWVTVK